MTISNCNTCDHYSRQEPETKLAAAHCYMFRVAPEGICMQHSHGREPKLSEIAMPRKKFSQVAYATLVGVQAWHSEHL